VGFALAADADAAADDDDAMRPRDLERAVDRLVSESFSVNASSRRTPPVFDLAPRSAGAEDMRMLLCGHAIGRVDGEGGIVSTVAEQSVPWKSKARLVATLGSESVRIR